MSRKVIRELLSHYGYEVCGEAENGLEAVTKAKTLKPDVVILDLVMPYANGLIAARHISQALPEAHLVLFTLHVVPQLEIEARKHKIDCVVSKCEAMGVIAFLDRLRDGHRSAGWHMTVRTPLQPEDLKKAS